MPICTEYEYGLQQPGMIKSLSFLVFESSPMSMNKPRRVLCENMGLTCQPITCTHVSYHLEMAIFVDQVAGESCKAIIAPNVNVLMARLCVTTQQLSPVTRHNKLSATSYGSTLMVPHGASLISFTHRKAQCKWYHEPQ